MTGAEVKPICPVVPKRTGGVSSRRPAGRASPQSRAALQGDAQHAEQAARRRTRRQDDRKDDRSRGTNGGARSASTASHQGTVGISRGSRRPAEGEEMKRARLTAKARSNTGFFIVMACCALGAIALIALLVDGEIKGARVGPDIQQKAKVD